MTDGEKLELLRSLELLKNIPPGDLTDLARFLATNRYAAGEAVFAEGDAGDSLFFIGEGGIRIEKRGGRDPRVTQVLAYLHRGDCFGEMALIEDVPRSASAIAESDTLLLKLDRKSLFEWLNAQPVVAMAFFTELVGVLSRRLRRTTSELTMLYDFSSLLLEPFTDAKDLMGRVIRRILPRLEGEWAAAAYLYNVYNLEMERVDVEGDLEPLELAEDYLPGTGSVVAWIDERSACVPLPGHERPMGYLLFRSRRALAGDARNEVGRTLTTLGRLVTSALENVEFKSEERLRERLRRQSGRAYL